VCQRLDLLKRNDGIRWGVDILSVFLPNDMTAKPIGEFVTLQFPCCNLNDSLLFIHNGMFKDLVERLQIGPP
jgi:hypothetical protein